MTRLSLLNQINRYGKIVFLVVAAITVGSFIYVSTGLVRDLSRQERERMEIWADATREIIASVEESEAQSVNIDFLLHIIESNTTIPVLLTDFDGNILQYRNFDLPEAESTPGIELSDANKAFLLEKLHTLQRSSNVIDIEIIPGAPHHIYYEDSTLLKRLSYYPFVVIAVMIAFVVVVYFAMLSTKRAEQNKVWVGLSKETAHQLGTPISSLMAWMELLPEMGVGTAEVAEMNKDVNRLSTIASRFSKIGSAPQMEDADLNEVVGHAATYMASRISHRINLTIDLCDEPLPVKACPPLFEWVMENLIKNAVDAMDGKGAIHVSTGHSDHHIFIEVEDTGKGISRKNFKTIFNPGYTTKSRGWGLGLALAKRIIEQYHRGSIYVKSSQPGRTVFRIDLAPSK